jgi:hydrogenase nickel incorporation protein HypA/HybF
MHELALAQEILRIAEETAAEASADLVTRIDIEVGTLAGVMVHALEFGLEASKINTLAESATIEIQTIDGRGICGSCKKEYPAEAIFAQCPLCSDSFLSIVSGTELKVKAIEVECDVNV